LILFFTTWWLFGGAQTINIKHLVIFKSDDVEIFINFFFDKITAVFAITGSIITFLVSRFSKFYMHREEGFKRFFTALLLFSLGYNLIIFSGNFETLFVGWEILGICSFLLIAFYRDRYLPVKNGLKVISFFRFADICLLLAMWMSHHLWHENITFQKLNDNPLVQSALQHQASLGIFIAVMILITSIIKSAQIPFSSWLPRAMEGPTTSSAIFYGSLSVHLGAFLLLRTYPFWETLTIIKVLVISTGVITAVLATGIASVQSTVKTQIAYSSVAQIGLIFIEVGIGWHSVALVHFSANAFLRTYQLLVSPSVMSYLSHDQFYNFSPDKTNVKKSLTKLQATYYILNIKEWNLDFLLYRLLWRPFKWAGNRFQFIKRAPFLLALTLVFGLGVYGFFNQESLTFPGVLPYVFAVLALTLILKAFSERGDALKAWMFAFSSQFFTALSIALNKQFDILHVVIYLSGGIVAGIVGFICLKKIRSIDFDIDLDRFHGYVYEKPTLALVFLLCCLGVVAFPISPAFIGFDLLLMHIGKDQFGLIAISSLSFIFLELSVLRIYCRVFLGQHKKAYHPIAYKSS
jgi:NADH:ubiquinone oxidoreductase subunit 5 (subunit L)/multisubunit Na+/H+ antiporter MnhA subunit